MSIIKYIINIYSNNPKSFWLAATLGLFCVLMKIYYPKFRGFKGEFWVKLELKKLSNKNYVVLNNIMIKDEYGTHQIDHIVLSNHGIFVIEMKNYYGLITGREYDSKWCQHLGKTKHYFMNPIYQNYGHIKTLSKLLNIDERYFVSIICFSNQAKIKVNIKNVVIQLDYLVDKILEFKEITLAKDIIDINNIIKINNITDREIRKKHIKGIHHKIENNNKLVNNMTCPRCGGTLVTREGKYGKFIGCSNYPKCYYKKK